jgi:DNA-binding response OmpR family regulator
MSIMEPTQPTQPQPNQSLETASPPPAPPTSVQPVPAQIQPQQFGASQRIVIVEDNTSLADIYKIRLELLGYKCFVAYDGREALSLIEQELPDLVLLDLMVPKVAGDQILEIMRSSDWGKDIKVQIISNLNEVDAPAGLREQGIEGYAVKANLSNDQLDQLVDNILKPVDQKEDIVLG